MLPETDFLKGPGAGRALSRLLPLIGGLGLFDLVRVNELVGAGHVVVVQEWLVVDTDVVVHVEESRSVTARDGVLGAGACQRQLVKHGQVAA